jgi:hypothetical protein
VERYGGTPLALRVVGESVRQLFGGDVAAFLREGEPFFGDVGRVLDEQTARLSAPEMAVLRRLAVAREPVGVAELSAALGPAVGPAGALAALEALRRRSLLERGARGATFTLQSVVLEHATDRLVEGAAEEIAAGRPDRLVGQALVTATASDHVRRSQEHLIAGPPLARLAAHLGGAPPVERRLTGLLDRLRARPPIEQGYGPGNVVNLLRLLRGHLRGIDLSGLAIRQAYLQEVEAQDASLANAHLAESVLGEAFDVPLPVALSADGTYLAAGMSDGEVWLWRLADRRPTLSVLAHASMVTGVALSGDGGLVASANMDGAVKVWEAPAGRLLATLSGHTGGVWGVALSADGGLVASGGQDGTVRLWEAASGAALRTLRSDRRYERLDITGLTGVSEAQRGALIALGAVEQPNRPTRPAREFP